MVETGVLLAAVVGVAVSTLRLTWRTVGAHAVTLVHELGHAAAAVAVGARPSAIRLHRDGSGLTAWGGRRSVGQVRRAFVVGAGVPAPALLALACLAAVAEGWGRVALVGLAITVGAVALLVRNLWGVLVVVALLAGVVLSWRASDEVAEVVVAAVGALLAVGAVRSAWTGLRVRRSQPGSDAAQLAGLTGLPAGLCAGAQVLVCVAAGAAGGWVFLAGA